MIREYKTNFRISAYFVAGWTVIVAAVLVYLLLTDQQPVELTWEQNREDFSLYLLAGVIASYGTPLLSWKRVVLDSSRKELLVQKAVDKLVGNTQVYSFREIASVEKKYNFWSQSKILFITLRNGKVVKLNTSFLKDRSELGEELLQLKENNPLHG